MALRSYFAIGTVDISLSSENPEQKRGHVIVMNHRPTVQMGNALIPEPARTNIELVSVVSERRYLAFSNWYLSFPKYEVQFYEARRK